MKSSCFVIFYIGLLGASAVPMREEVSHLTLRDMIDVTAYAGSQNP